MKKIICLVALLVLCFAISACGDSANTNTQITLRPIENISEYVIVRGDSSTENETLMAQKLRTSINEATGASVVLKTDYYNNTYEILVGVTKRRQTTDTMKDLRYFDYTIKQLGNKIVIVGGSDESLEKAVDLFLTQFVDTEQKTVKVPTGEGYTYKATYAVDALTIDGLDVSEFKFHNNSLESTGDFIESLRTIVGADPVVHPEELLKDEHYIILDGTELIADKYSITVEDGNLIIKGSAHSLPTAIEYFENEVMKGKEITLTSSSNYEGSTGKKETYTKEQLGQVIQQLYDDPNIMAVGEEVQRTNAYAVENAIDIFYEATGQKPGILGIDLACYGIDLTMIDDRYLSSYVCDLVDYVADGGMVTASAHWANPSETDEDRVRGNFGTVNTREAYEKAFKDLLTEGTQYNEFFKAELEINARFFQALEDNGVPIIWRPLHEANGNWFWFCVGQQDHWLEPKYIIDIWHYVYDYFENECGLTNLYWCYAPNVSANVEDVPGKGGSMSTTYLYPGDEYCDMVGVDWYEAGGTAIASEDNYLNLVDLSGKPGAITEFGVTGPLLADTIDKQPELYTCMDMYDTIYRELIAGGDGYSFAYLLTWGAQWGVTAMSLGEELMNTDLCIGQAEVKAMFDALK